MKLSQCYLRIVQADVEFLTFPNQVVSDASVRRVVPLVFIFVVLSRIVSFMAPGCHGVHFGSSGGSWGSVFAVLAVSLAAFWKLWGSLGLHFSTFGCLLGYILGALGAWWPLGRFGGPYAPPTAQNRILSNVSFPFWKHVGSCLGRTLDAKIDETLDANLMRFWG